MKLYHSMWSSENTDEEDEGSIVDLIRFKTRLVTMWSPWETADHKNRWDYSDSTLSPYLISWNDHIWLSKYKTIFVAIAWNNYEITIAIKMTVIYPSYYIFVLHNIFPESNSRRNSRRCSKAIQNILQHSLIEYRCNNISQKLWRIVNKRNNTSLLLSQDTHLAY